MAIDLNFDNITLAVFTMNGRLIKLKRLRAPLRRILTQKVRIERIQKRYPRSWRFIKGVKRAIEKHGERIRNISWDYAHKVGDLIANLAIRYCSLVVLENLDKLRDNAKKGRRFNKKLALCFYRKIQFSINYEAKERGLIVFKVNPRGTSFRCPTCGSRLLENGYRTLKCSKCGFIEDRDVAATINLFKTSSRSSHLNTQDVGSPGSP